ncbi:hypothetical protein UlMin_004433, partial [Ulmus minor]
SRYKLDKDWQKDWCMKEMAELWRTSKSRLVSKLNKLPNDEQRLQLKPHNIKSEAEWRAFVQEKTSEKFQERSNKFREIRKNQLPHTCSPRGFAQTIDDMNRDSSKPVTWVNFYTSEKFERSGKNKINRSKTKYTSLHGTKTYSATRYAKRNPETQQWLGVIDSFKTFHTDKKGRWVNEAAAQDF